MIKYYAAVPTIQLNGLRKAENIYTVWNDESLVCCLQLGFWKQAHCLAHPRYSKVPVLQWYGHPRVLGIPILFSVLPGFRGSQTLVIWASPVTLTLSLTQIGKVIWEENTHITRVLGMGMPKTRGCPHHCNTGNFSGRNQIFKSKSKNPNPIQCTLFC